MLSFEAVIGMFWRRFRIVVCIFFRCV